MSDAMQDLVEQICTGVHVSSYWLRNQEYPLTEVVDINVTPNTNYYVTIYEGVMDYFGFNVGVLSKDRLADESVLRIGQNLIANLASMLDSKLESSILATQEEDGSVLGSGIVLPELNLAYLPLDVVIRNLNAVGPSVAIALLNPNDIIDFPILGYVEENLNITTEVEKRVLS